jgi:hypothetical protein
LSSNVFYTQEKSVPEKNGEMNKTHPFSKMMNKNIKMKNYFLCFTIYICGSITLGALIPVYPEREPGDSFAIQSLKINFSENLNRFLDISLNYIYFLTSFFLFLYNHYLI